MASTIPAHFWRGGTSNGLLILAKHLSRDTRDWAPLLCPAMGSGDPYSRQLNGMGGGISSLSKICVVAPSTRPDADVEYTFIQVGIEDYTLDMAGNCGNMSSAVGPFALDQGLLPVSTLVHDNIREEPHGGNPLTVRLFNTNTSKIIHSKFKVTKTKGSRLAYHPAGTFAIDGVSGTASPIALSFLDPAGSKTRGLLPSGLALDQISLSNGMVIETSLVDAANPAVFIRASDVGVTLPCSGVNLDNNSELMKELEEIRRIGATRMGLDPHVKSIPKLLLVSEPQDEEFDIRALALSMGRCHKAIPLTYALNLGVSCSIQGTLPHSLRRPPRNAGSGVSDSTIRIGHASGSVDVQAEIGRDGENEFEVSSATLMRTARLLMKGDVNCA